MRPTALVLVALTASLLAADTAVAGTVGIEGDTLHYVAAPGEFNALTIMLQGDRFTIQDGSTGNRDTLYVTAQPPCYRDATPLPDPGLIDAYCPPAGVNRIAVELGDQNDYAGIGGMTPTDFPATIDGGDGADTIYGGPQADVIHGGPGNDTLQGNAGRDVLSGDEGDDTINAADGWPDQVTCGPGFDTVTADSLDTVADDCELLNGQPLPPPPPPAPPPPPPDTTAPALQLGGAASQRIARQRAVIVVVACPTEACSATARGTVTVPGSAKVFKLTPVSKQISVGSKASLRLGIARRALTAIAHALKRHRRVSARITVAATDGAKNTTTKQRTIRLTR